MVVYAYVAMMLFTYGLTIELQPPRSMRAAVPWGVFWPLYLPLALGAAAGHLVFWRGSR